MQWLLADNQGTVRDVANASGSVIDHLTVDAFGNITSQTAGQTTPRLVYAGYQFDPETGLYQDGARYYDPSAGRFLSEDPSGFTAGDRRVVWINICCGNSGCARGSGADHQHFRLRQHRQGVMR